MPDKISILKESGETLSSNVVSVFMIPDTEKKYIITTENAVDPHGLTVLHVSEIVDGALQKIATDDEWSSIKTIMRAIISGNVGSYQYLPTIESINASGQYSRDISVSASASKQMIDNYAAGEKSNISVTPETAPAPEAVQAPAPDAAAPAAPATQPSIFPTGNAEVANDDELIPGISEVGAAPANPASVPVDNTAVPVAQPVVQPQPAVAETPQVVPAAVPPVTPVEAAPSTPEVVPPVAVPAPENVSPAVAVDNAVVQPVVVNPEPVVAIPTPVVAEAAPVNNLSNEVQVVPGIPEQPVVSNVSTMTASNIQVNNDLIAPTPVVVSTEPEPIPVVPVMPDASQPVPAIPVVETEPETDAPTEAETEAATEVITEIQTETGIDESDIVWGESYTAPEDVAEYIYLYGELPENFITKREAGNLGWESSEGNLWEVAPGMSIGGDKFGNREGILPKGKQYYECDIDYNGGYRNEKRIVYTKDGWIYYTEDHYETFEQLYP